MKRKKGDIIKAYVIEKTTQYGTVYHAELCPNRWSVSFENADIYTDKQTCKNEAARLIDEQIEYNQKYPDVVLINDITIRELEIKFVN